MMGATVAAKSHLATELHHTLVQASTNLLKEVTVPQDLENFRGYDGKTTKTNITDEFSFEFGASGEFSSELDNAAKVLYEALGEKTKIKDEKQDMLAEITEYFKNCILLDD